MSTEEPRPTKASGAEAGDSRSSDLSGLTEAIALGPVEPAVDPLLGKDFGGVMLVRLIAEGGMGRVYEGLQDRPRRPVAVKVMRPGFVSHEACRRFDNEAEVLGRLRHRCIAQIFSAGICNVAGARVPYFVMEFIPDALPITKYVAHRKLSTDERLDLFRKVCDAVAHGHEKGIIHRDLKPSNILVEPSGEPKIIDFGVARCIDASPEAMTAMTDMGQLIGTVQYMSPEQFAANPAEIDVRSDVYALGVILYELLTGRPPYEIRHKQIFEAARVVREQKPVSPAKLNNAVRPDVARITGRCLHKDRTRRYANAAEVVSAIDCYLSGQPVAEPKRGAFADWPGLGGVVSWLKPPASVPTWFGAGWFGYLVTAICFGTVLVWASRLILHEFVFAVPQGHAARAVTSGKVPDDVTQTAETATTAATSVGPADPPPPTAVGAGPGVAPIAPAQNTSDAEGSKAASPATDFKYEIKGNAVTITGYLGEAPSVRIPDRIEGRPVTVVGHEAFRDRTDLVKVQLPKSLVVMESGAFFNCARLNELTLPEGLLHIRDGALVGTELATLTIPASVIVIEDCLYVARKLKEVLVHPENQHFTSIDGILYDKQVHTLLRCPPVRAGEVVVPPTVHTIAGHAFAGCAALDRVVLPEGPVRIGGDAFSGCTLRERLEPAGPGKNEHFVTYCIRSEGIEVNGYRGQGGDVQIPEKIVGRPVVTIASDAFNGQANIRSVVLPPSVENIGNAAFAGCSTMERITMPENLVGIGFNAFQFCKRLKSIDIPASVSHIGAVCFFGSSGLEEINVVGSNAKFASVDGVLYDKDVKTLITCPPGKEGRVAIPATVKSIQGWSFAGCRRLTHIAIPESVTTLDARAFEDCDAVRETVQLDAVERP